MVLLAFQPQLFLRALHGECVKSDRGAAIAYILTPPAHSPEDRIVPPLVSILIPAYNAEEWIAETLDSALAQTWHAKEILVVDDGSTDRTRDIARRFTKRGVRVISQSHQGAAAARNHALSLSGGDYIQWLDADDLLAPDKIAKQLEAAARCADARTLLSSEWGRFMYRPTRAQFAPTALWCDLTPTEWLRRKLAMNLYMQTATWLVSRTLTSAAGPWNVQLLVDDDGEYFGRVLLQSDGVRFVAGARVFYRTAAGAASLSYIGPSSRKLDAQFQSMQLHIGYLRSLEDTDRTRAACIAYLQNGLPLFYPERRDLFEKSERLAADLGGQLAVPRFSWKYAWIKALCGPMQAKRAQSHLREFKWSLVRRWHKAQRIGLN
jgi:glycosyl transferase family 2